MLINSPHLQKSQNTTVNFSLQFNMLHHHGNRIYDLWIPSRSQFCVNYSRREIPSRTCRTILLLHLTQHKQITVPCIVIKHWNPIIFHDWTKQKRNGNASMGWSYISGSRGGGGGCTFKITLLQGSPRAHNTPNPSAQAQALRE